MPSMRLLVPDRYAVYSGVETINRRLLPALVRQGVPVTWALPDHRLADFRADPECAGLGFEDAFWPRRHWRRWAEALARRGGRARPLAGYARRWETRSYRARLEELGRRHGATHVLNTWILSEDFPRLSRPHSAFFLDRNWARAPGEVPGARAQALDARVRTWAAGAHRMLAISENAADELRELAPEHAAKVVRVPLAATPPLVAPVPPAGNAPGRGVVFYYPATANPHKNHRTLFAAAAHLAAEGLAFRVILSGFATPGLLGREPLAEARTEEARLCFDRHRALLAERIEARGYGTPRDVENNYQAADCVVLPSEYEGFGLPLAEALRRMRPVIASTIAPFREQIAFYRAEEVVLPFDPASVDGLAAQMRRVIAGRAATPAALAAVAGRVADWSWDDVARTCLDALAAPPNE